MSAQRPERPQQNNPINQAMGDALTKAQAATGTASPQGAPNVNQQQATQAGANARRQSIVDANANLRRNFSRNSSGEYVQKFEKTLKKLFSENLGEKWTDSYRLIVLDNQSANVALSSILLCYYERTNVGDFVSVATLIVEASAAALQNRTTNIGGTPVEIEVVPGDIFWGSDDFWIQAVNAVTESYGNVQVNDAGAQVLPRELDPEDEHRLRGVLYQASSACQTIMDNVLGGVEEPFNVGWVQAGDSLSARVDFGNDNIENAVGLPLRADVIITQQGSLNNTASNPGQFEQVKDISIVTGYVDLVFVPPPAPALGQAPMTQSYFPRFVMTRLDTQIDANTLELQLAALASAFLLTRGSAYRGSFKPRPISGTDLHDIGAIGYEVNLTGNPNAEPDRILTKDDSFGNVQLQQLLQAAVHDGLMYSLDIEETGELAWIHQTFIAAANNDPTAVAAIVQAANNLTKNVFGTIWNNGQIAQDDGTRIHLGYFVDNEGRKHDLREIDYLAMLNLAGRDHPGLIQEFENTYVATNVPLEIRLEKRIKLIKGFISGKLEVKNFARRITFAGDFIVALARSIEAAGLHIRPTNLVEQYGGVYQRGQYNTQNFAVNGQAVGNLFAYQQPGFGRQSGNYNAPFTGRFGR